MSLFNELKRRNVFRVGAAYLVVAWLLLQIMDTVAPIIGLSDAFARGVLFLIVIGFPIVLIVSWVFELTSEGLQTQAVADESGARTHAGKLNTVIIGGMALVIVFLVVDNYVLEEPAEGNGNTPIITEAGTDIFQDEIIETTDIENSIAVLPFDDLSPDMDQEYFADGLTEELINKLSQVEDLLVTGRNSSFYFKERDDDLIEIGQVLGVEHILQGSIRKAGNQLRITAQLMDVNSNANLWSETFDREIADIFSIQDEIAEAVTTALSVTLRAGAFSQPGMTGNVEAFDAFMLGQKYLRDASNGEGFRINDAIAEIERAVRLDPTFSIGWLSLAGAYRDGIAILPADQSVGFSDRIDDARSQARRLTPELPQFQLGDIRSLFFAEQDYAQAEQLVLEIIEASRGSDTNAALNYATMLWIVGRVQEALPYVMQARRQDPLSPGSSFFLSVLLLNLGREDEALLEIERGLTLGANAQNLSGNRVIAALTRDDPQQVLNALAMMPVPSNILEELTTIWLNDGKEEARLALREVYEDGNLSQTFFVVLREWAAVLDDPELGLELLNTMGFTPGDIWLPLYSNIRQLPGFKDYVRRKGLLDYWQATGNWADFCRPLEGSDDFECF